MKVKLLDLDWQMKRIFKGDYMTRCLRCEMELYDDDDAKELKKMLARFEKIVEIVDPTDEDVKEGDELSMMIKSFNAKHANGGN